MDLRTTLNQPFVAIERQPSYRYMTGALCGRAVAGYGHGRRLGRRLAMGRQSSDNGVIQRIRTGKSAGKLVSTSCSSIIQSAVIWTYIDGLS